MTLSSTISKELEVMEWEVQLPFENAKKVGMATFLLLEESTR